MVDFKELLKEAKSTLTSPTAFSWYGVAGVVATGILTFLATKKWVELRSEIKEECWDKAENKIISEDNKPTITLDEAIDITTAYEKELKDRPFKEKMKEVAQTALIFTPPIAAAVGTSLCILHGNNKALASIGDLATANDLLSMRLDKYKSFAAGALTSEAIKHQKSEDDDEEVSRDPHRLYFSNDDLPHEFYGKRTRFYVEYTQKEFYSTPLEVVMGEMEFNRVVWDKRIGEFGSLNELLDMIGAPLEDYGTYCGWSKEAGFDNGYSWVGITHHKIDFDDGESGYLIHFESEPTYDELYHKLIHG